MACPTCSANMILISHDTEWCPTCGTIERPGDRYRNFPGHVPRIAAVLKAAGEAEVFTVVEIVEGKDKWGACVGGRVCQAPTPIAALAGCWREGEKQGG
jgi:hypothetical protein